MHKIPLIPSLTLISFLSLAIISLPVVVHSVQPAEVADIELDALRESGYRMDWMNRSNSTSLHLPTIIEESLYTLDGEDHLTRYDLHSGKWLWSAPVGNQVFSIRSITEFPKENLVYIVSDGAVYAIEKTTGNYPSQVNADGTRIQGQKQVLPLQWVANTPALSADNRTLIYGSTKGDVVWFDPTIGFNTHRYRVGSTVNVQPSYAAGIRNKNGLLRETIVSTSSDGNVLSLDLNQVNELWSFPLTSEVIAPIGYGTNTTRLDDEQLPRSSVFIAGTDQYLRAVDLHTGKPRWNILTTASLIDAPFFRNGVVYQRIPSVGLAAYNAFPDVLSGEELWLAEDVLGSVITTTKRGQLVSWDSEHSKLQVVDPRKGGVVSSLTLPNIKSLITDDSNNGSLYILTNDDVLIRLVPRNQ